MSVRYSRKFSIFNEDPRKKDDWRAVWSIKNYGCLHYFQSFQIFYFAIAVRIHNFIKEPVVPSAFFMHESKNK